METMRAQMNDRQSLPGPQVANIADRTVPGSEASVPVRVYTPSGAGPFPAVVWMHGGGWVLGGLRSSDATCREMANQARAVMVSVDYRLSPETKFPGAAQDCFDTLEWVVDNASDLNIDDQRLAIGGTSAGGNLAAVVALMVRDRGGPKLSHQVLVYPVVGHNFETDSYVRNAAGYGLTRATMIWYWEQYLANATDALNPYAAPLAAHNLNSLPPALVITAEYDPLLDDGRAYADRLREAGVPTTHSMYEGTIHAFFNAGAPLDGTEAAIAEACAALRTAFS